MDNTRGLLILLFAERGLFDSQLAPQMDEFARSRVEQGVPIFGRGPIHLIKLQPPGREEIETLIHARVGHLLSDFPRASELPAEFPFDEKFLKEPTPATQSLRNTLIRLPTNIRKWSMLKRPHENNSSDQLGKSARCSLERSIRGIKQ